ncbi:MAG: hypothetical protein HQL17_02255 [Candidatus Omnitrophica bacterium]|nr:hypothetical protein [Candidatus Omnitrophota bacterium]
MHRWSYFFIAFLLILVAPLAHASGAGKGDFDPALINWLRTNVSAKTGMPFSFAISGDKKDVYSRIGMPASPTGIIERVILEEGISIYDAAVWQIVMGATGDARDLQQAMKPVKYYWDGAMEGLFNIRTGSGGSVFVYDPVQPDAVTSQLSEQGRRGFIFRIIDANGAYQMSDPLDGSTVNEDFPNDPNIHWEDWKPIAGENAWVVIAALHLLEHNADVQAGTVRMQDTPEFRLAVELARAAMFLQAENGGIRMAPLGTYNHLLNIKPGLSEAEITHELDQRSLQFKSAHKVKAPLVRVGVQDYPDYHAWHYEEISTENNLSWYAAMRMLFKLTGNEEYRTVMQGIETYLRSAWNAQDNVFYQGAHYTQGRWMPNPEPFAEDVQSWAIMVLGPEVLDQWFGEGAAYHIWQKTRAYAGVFASDGRLQGVGFTLENDRLSVEWTAGAIMAVRQLEDYYASMHPQWVDGLKQDARSMREGIDQFRFAASGDRASYAYSSKRGWIPFGWFSQAPEVQSLVSTAWVALVDAGINPFILSSSASFAAKPVPVDMWLGSFRENFRHAIATSYGIYSFGFFPPAYFLYNFLH